MSSVLHPVGPEPEKRYWVRRVAVIVVAIVAIAIVIGLVNSATSSGTAVQAEPPAPTLIAPPTTSSPTSTPTPSASASPSGSSTPTASSSATSSPSPSPSASSSSSKSDSDDDQSADSKKSGASTKSKKTTPTYSACDPSTLRTTLTGEKTVKLKDDTTFALSLINGGTKTCRVTATSKTFTLTVVSGSDRIWSTKDCPKAQPNATRVLLPEHALEWKVTWSGKRSGDGCSTGKAAPKKGYYVAIANFDDAKDVRFRLQLT